MISETRHADKKMKLGEVCNLILGQSPSSDSYNTDGVGLPFYQGNADFGEDHPTPRVWCNEPKKVVLPGDILISVRAPIGAINVADEKCCIGRGVAAIEPYCKIVSRDFLKQQLLAKRAMLESRGTGSTFKAVGKRALLDFPIRVYPLPEQAHIEQQFKQVLSSISACRHYLTLLDALVKSRFVEMFGGTGISKKHLEDIADIQGGITKNRKREALKLQLPYLRVANVLPNELDLTEVKTIGLTEQEYEAVRLMPGDLLIVEGNGSGTQIGRSAIWNGQIAPCVHQNHLIRVRLKDEALPHYVQAFLSSSEGRRQIMAKAVNTSGLHTISTGKIRSLEIPVPPFKLQQEFASFVAEVDKSKSIAQKQIEKLQLLYDSLAQEYFGD